MSELYIHSITLKPLMKRQLNTLLAICTLLLLPFVSAQAATQNFTVLKQKLARQTNLSQSAINMAFSGYNWALKQHKVRNKNILTIVDFSLASYKKRLYVIDLNSGKVLMSLFVSHGKNSGENKPYATRFSNQPNSLESSLGVYVTRNSYYGKFKYALRLSGLESSNNKALSRAIVVHSANYAAPWFIKRYGYAGNSYGCFAVDPSQNARLINYIRNGSVLYAYAASKKYLASTHIAAQQA